MMGDPPRGRHAIACVDGLCFDYPGVRALDGVGFELERGTVTALVGPNGAGKTTLLRCLAALETPLAGRIEVDGVDVLESPREAHRHLGYLSDFFGVYDALTVEQCLVHAAAAQGVEHGAVAAAVRRTAERLGLGDRLRTVAGTLSRGLRQRLAIGQALVHAPALLLLDEPAAGLDPEARHALAALFRTLQREGMTLVVSSHILAELDEYSTHMMVLREGRVLEQRALDGSSTTGRRFRVMLAAADARLGPVLERLAGVDAIDVGEAGGTFRWDGAPAAQAAVLRALLDAGLAVTSFDEERRDLHASYLETVGRT